jgi:hypothetical protein
MNKVEKLANEIRESLSYRGLTAGDACAIHEILDKHAPIEKPFPKVMIGNHSRALVLFHSKSNGTILTNGTRYERVVGDSPEDWDMSEFKDCEIKPITSDVAVASYIRDNIPILDEEDAILVNNTIDRVSMSTEDLIKLHQLYRNILK